MQIVIDIPDKDRRDIYWVKGKRVANLIGEYKVITVLPEEHGDLIDRSNLLSKEKCCCRIEFCSGSCEMCSDNCVEVSDIAMAEVIIPDNKEIMNDG